MGLISTAFKLRRFDKRFGVREGIALWTRKTKIPHPRDDSEFVRSHHTHILEQFFCSRYYPGGRQRWLEKLYSRPFDLVLTDINMNHMDGYEFIRRIRDDAKYSLLPIIIVSTESEGKDKTKGFEVGANLYIVKPCAPEIMVENIRMILVGN